MIQQIFSATDQNTLLFQWTHINRAWYAKDPKDQINFIADTLQEKGIRLLQQLT